MLMSCLFLVLPLQFIPTNAEPTTVQYSVRAHRLRSDVHGLAASGAVEAQIGAVTVRADSLELVLLNNALPRSGDPVPGLVATGGHLSYRGGTLSVIGETVLTTGGVSITTRDATVYLRF